MFSWTPINSDPTVDTFIASVSKDVKNEPQKKLPRDNLTEGERQALVSLQNNENIVITRADKGGAIVIWGIHEYVNDAQKHLSNKTFYKQLDFDPSEDYARIIFDSLSNLKNSKSINDELANSLIPDKTKTARFYLLPKIHKANNPGTPVVSSINCNRTKLSKFVDYHIQPLAKKVKS